MEVSYSPEGLDAGLRLTKAGVSVRITSYAQTTELTDAECEKVAQIFLRFHEDVGRLAPASEPVVMSEDVGQVGVGILERPLQLIQPSPTQFVKYTTKDAFDAYYAKGQFRLGSIIAFRQAEDDSVRDPQEGYCNIVVRSRGEHHLATVQAGKNLRLFCGSASSGNSYLASKFGGVQMLLRDPSGFGEAVKRLLDARSWKYGRITYARQKIFRIAKEIDFSVAPEKLLQDPGILNAFHAFVVDECAPGTVFLKPQGYALEDEARFVFEMREDFVGSYITLNDSSLLDFFEISEL